MYRQFAVVLIGALLIFAAACGSDSPSGPEDQGEPTSSLECSAPALAATEAVPFSRVTLTGVSGIDQDTWVDYETESGTQGMTVVLPKEGGGFEIVVPAHPDQLMAGGTLTLTVTDGVGRCAPLTIDVLPTDPVTGDPLGDAMSVLGDLADAFATHFGLNPSTLRSTTLDQLSPEAVPVAVLLEAYDAMDVRAELGAMTDDQVSFIQAMVTGSGIKSALEGTLASVEALSTGALPRMAPLGPTASARRDGCTDLGTVPGDLFDLSSPDALSDYMKAARGAGDPSGPLNQAIGTVGNMFAVMGLARPEVGFVGGYLAFSAQLVQKMRANLYPSAISKLEYQVDQNRIEEDWDTTDGDPEIKWRFAKVWATNNGMGLARVGLDFIATGVPLPGPFGNDVANGLFDIAGKDAINKRLNELEKDPDTQAECWGVGSTEFGPVVIPEDSGEKWVRAELTSGDAIVLEGPDKRELKPQKIGTASLRVRTQEDPFPGPFGFEDKTIEVLRKEVRWIPRTLIVENPGEDVTIKFRVDNSRHNDADDVDITEGPNLPPMFPVQNGEVHEVTFTTPTEEGAYPTWVEARSTSKELPPDAPNRSARIEILYKEFVEIEKKDVCVGSGESESFTATAGGPDNPEVMWEITAGAGTLSSDTGLMIDYMAPSAGSGTVTLRAYLSTNSEVEDFITFRYGVCSGLAVYYAAVADISFPFGPDGECNNPDLDDEFEEISMPEEGLLPEVLPSPSDTWVGRNETLSASLSDQGQFGYIPPGSEACSVSSFRASSSYRANLVGSADGTRLDVDITTAATSEIKQMGDRRPSSGAGAAVAIAGRWDFDITEATDYRLQLNLSCDSFTIPGFPVLSGRVSIIAIQIDPSGTPVPGNLSTAPIQVQCQPGVPLVIDQLMQFPAPSQNGQKDHVMVMFTFDNASVGATDLDEGLVERDGFLRGFLSLKRE